MITTGIVMECNPFHEGHQYILNEARRTTGADYVIVILSGDYVQRGIPAIYSKEYRTRTVLAAGADLVLELPLPYATGAANYFATGAMSMLISLGVVTDLAFGSLMADADAIRRIAALLDEEPPEFKALLQSGLAAGLSYPAARAAAAAGALGISLPTNGNDVLGIEYVRALNTISPNHAIRIHAIPRIETDSATTWRARLLAAQQRDTTIRSAATIPQDPITGSTYLAALPTQSGSKEQSSAAAASIPYCMSADDFSNALYYCLQSLTGLSGCIDIETAAASLMAYQDVDHDLACRMVRLLPEYTGWSDYAERLKTRNITYTRVSRALLHILLQVRKDDLSALCGNVPVGYARVLGFRRSAGPLLSALQEQATIPLVTRPRTSLNSESIPLLYRQQLRRDLAASELYDHTVCAHDEQTNKGRICELSKQVIAL